MIAVLTNLPKGVAAGVPVAELYRDRWTRETMFQSLTMMLDGELKALGYLRAALFGFAVALAAYNVLSTVQAALRATHGTDKVNEEVSGYYIANEVRTTQVGMSAALEEPCWAPFQTMNAHSLASELMRYARNVNLRALKRHPRGPKKPVPKRTRFTEKRFSGMFSGCVT